MIPLAKKGPLSRPVLFSEICQQRQREALRMAATHQRVGTRRISLVEGKPGQLYGKEQGNTAPHTRAPSWKEEPTLTPHNRVPSFIAKKQSENMHIRIDPRSDPRNDAPLRVDRSSFQYKFIIGKGGFGKVWKVEHTKSRRQFAMKEMLKSIVMSKKSVQSVMNEKVLLTQTNSPFLVNIHYAFQDRETLYLVLDLMDGGDLRYHLCNRSFSEVQAKFLLACLIQGLEHMHNQHILHRDIKPQNLVLDSRGYLRITDLGIARLLRPDNASDTSGTPGYMCNCYAIHHLAPEVICRQNHSYVSDYFAVGVIAHELMTGRRPYVGRSRNQIRDNMLARQAQLKPTDVPPNWSLEAMDFVNRLIQRKPESRLGVQGIQQIKSHPWIRTVNWEKISGKQIEAPFVPLMKKHHFDQDDKITVEDEEEAELIEKNSLLLRRPQFQQLFGNYYYERFQQERGIQQPSKKGLMVLKTNTKTESVTIESTPETRRVYPSFLEMTSRH